MHEFWAYVAYLDVKRYSAFRLVQWASSRLLPWRFRARNNPINIGLSVPIAFAAEFAIYGYLAALDEQCLQIILSKHHQGAVCPILGAGALILQLLGRLQSAGIFMKQPMQQGRCVEGCKLCICHGSR